MTRTKIIATLGPATDAPGVLDALIAAGLDVARLNASHSSRDDLARRAHVIRAGARARGRHVAIMLDLGGPKLRLGEVKPGSMLEKGRPFELRTGEGVGDGEGACVTHAGLAADVAVGARILLDDGRLELLVREVSDGTVVTEVITGGALTSHAGVNVPGARLAVDAITRDDLDDLAWGIDFGVDLVAQSFVRSAHDVLRLRMHMGEHAIPIVAKIEKHEAVADLEAIVEAADGVMVARGDLGVETSPEQVPVIQRRVVAACRAAGRPVIIATQMLESMRSATRPTRAEASDVANAIFDQVDAVMLSGETAVGEHPVESVETMIRIAAAAESVPTRPIDLPLVTGEGLGITRAVSAAAAQMARDLDLAAIVTATQSGATARAVAARRPLTPIIAVTPSEGVARRLALVWGVKPLVVPQHGSIEEMLQHAVAAVRDAGLVAPGALVALTAGVAVGVAGGTNLLQVTRV